jgi:hypothetical protein
MTLLGGLAEVVEEKGDGIKCEHWDVGHSGQMNVTHFTSSS